MRLVTIASAESSVIGSKRSVSRCRPSGVSEKTSATNTMSKQARSAVCANVTYDLMSKPNG